MNQQQLIEQKAKELLIQNCGTPTIGDNGEMTADLDYYIESDAALSTMIEFGEWMQGEGERLREERDYLDEIAHHENREVVRLKNEVVAVRTALAFIADHAESMTKENIAGHAKMMLLCIPDPKPQSK